MWLGEPITPLFSLRAIEVTEENLLSKFTINFGGLVCFPDPFFGLSVFIEACFIPSFFYSTQLKEICDFLEFIRESFASLCLASLFGLSWFGLFSRLSFNCFNPIHNLPKSLFWVIYFWLVLHSNFLKNNFFFFIFFQQWLRIRRNRKTTSRWKLLPDLRRRIKHLW